jgi:hypothetical protein
MKMQELRHPLTRAMYGLEPDSDLVRVTDGNKSGLYTKTGVWVSGDQFDVDPEMCLWVGGPNPAESYGSSYRQLG